MKTGIEIAIKGGIATITINRPKQRNALDLASADTLKKAVHTIDANDKVKAVILTGAGGVFCAGADLKHRALEREADSSQRAHWDDLAGET